MAKQTLHNWIHEALNETKDGPCTSVSLVHRANGGKEQEVYTLPLGGKQWDAVELGNLFKRKAEDYASELVGVQQFNLLAFYKNANQPGALKPFTEKGQMDFDGMATEAPTKDGMFQQGMRHLEVMAQTYVNAQAKVLEMAIRVGEIASRENINLRQENREASEMVREVLFDMTTKTQEHQMNRLKYERDTAERAKWFSFGPALINSILGRDVFPQSSADTALIESLAESLSEEDALRISQMIKPELWGPLAQRFGKVMREKRLATSTANGVDHEYEVSGIAKN